MSFNLYYKDEREEGQPGNHGTTLGKKGREFFAQEKRIPVRSFPLAGVWAFLGKFQLRRV
ncbi:MAG: hypothetical protein ACLTJB_07375 [Holdemania filiformis]